MTMVEIAAIKMDDDLGMASCVCIFVYLYIYIYRFDILLSLFVISNYYNVVMSMIGFHEHKKAHCYRGILRSQLASELKLAPFVRNFGWELWYTLVQLGWNTWIPYPLVI